MTTYDRRGHQPGQTCEPQSELVTTTTGSGYDPFTGPPSPIEGSTTTGGNDSGQVIATEGPVESGRPVFGRVGSVRLVVVVSRGSGGRQGRRIRNTGSNQGSTTDPTRS